VPGALEWDGGGRPTINATLCTGCAQCREACIVDPKAISVAPLATEDRTPVEP
jgi:formate hydrogenlyase subunit 6/NADH:ubiquinone oxidoreductase subunit I